ncbi:hypothetical protein TA3x_002343 [Tundrisphaera sp. TA3]|uniref:hypothetical protein n=1 Tax=Tundrisphaera sp. TA3 TaxID=3435775 RepID=UPI003EB84E54
MSRRTRFWTLAMVGAGSALGTATFAQQPPAALPVNAAKAAPSYHAVSAAIADVTASWDQPGAVVSDQAPGWRAFFGALGEELDRFGAAADANARLASLGRLHKMDVALTSTSWEPAVRVRRALNAWLAPRIRIAWAGRNLTDYVKGQAGVAPENADHWVRFVGDDLGAALSSYEGAKTVQARAAALRRLTDVLAALRKGNQANPWTFSWELQGALDGLYNRPNLDASADVASVAPFLSNDVVQTGPVYRKGYVSQVTAGPRTGFGLLPSDDGIAFYNSQLASTATPITDFQQQLQQDRRGRKLSKLYYFSASSYDQPQITVTAVLRPTTGLSLIPQSTHAVSASFNSMPTQGKGLTRGLLGVIGLNQNKLTNLVAQNAIPKIASNVEREAAQEAAERIPGAEAEQNAKLRQVLPGDGTVAVKAYRINDVSFRSRPENVLVSGKVGHQAVPDAIGADMPQPPALIQPDAGVSVDVHLGSILSNVAAGALQDEGVRSIENVMIVTKATQPGAPPAEGVTVGRNVPFAEFLGQIDAARAANDPKTTALRIRKPGKPPEFFADARGYLVALVRDFQMDVPAPPGSERGGLLGAKAKVFRITIPTAEFILSFKANSATPGGPPTQVDAKVEDFVASSDAKVLGILDDENAAVPLGPLQANLILAGFRTKLQQVPINVPLTQLRIPGFDLRTISPLDPSGWMRVVLYPNGQPIPKPGQQVAQVEAPAPAPAVAAPAVAAPAPAVVTPTPAVPEANPAPAVTAASR